MVQKIEKKDAIKKILHLLAIGLFVCTPLLSGILLCAADGKTLADIYIPLGGWSDEITYYKQIEGMLSHGIPKGYFGYNQSQAMYGPFGYWGFLPLIPYVIWGRFFGWTYTSPIYANIAFCILAFIFIYVLLKPDKKWCVGFSFFWIFFQFFNRHVLSGAIEASLTLQLVVVIVLGERLLSDRVRNRIASTPCEENWFVAISTAMVFFLTVLRPYYAVFYLIPFWAVIRKKQLKGIIAVPATALLSLVCFVLYKQYTCAAYYEDVIHMDDMLAGGVAGIFTKLATDSAQIAKYIWYGIRYEDVTGWYYLFLLVELGIMLFVCIRRWLKKESAPRLYVATLIGNVLILISISLLFTLVVGGRHILPLIIVNAVLLLTETHVSAGWILGCIGILCTLLAGNNEPLPYANKEYVQWMENLEKTFAEHMEVTDILSYDNVVGSLVSGSSKEDPNKEAVPYYGYLYAVPAGMGVSIDFWEMYEEPENIKAKYIIAHPEAKVRDRLEEAGMKCVLEMDELVLYARE